MAAEFATFLFALSAAVVSLITSWALSRARIAENEAQALSTALSKAGDWAQPSPPPGGGGVVVGGAKRCAQCDSVHRSTAEARERHAHHTDAPCIERLTRDDSVTVASLEQAQRIARAMPGPTIITKVHPDHNRSKDPVLFRVDRIEDPGAMAAADSQAVEVWAAADDIEAENDIRSAWGLPLAKLGDGAITGAKIESAPRTYSGGQIHLTGFQYAMLAAADSLQPDTLYVIEDTPLVDWGSSRTMNDRGPGWLEQRRQRREHRAAIRSWLAAELAHRCDSENAALMSGDLLVGMHGQYPPAALNWEDIGL